MKPRPKLTLTGRVAGRGLVLASVLLLGAELMKALERGAYKTLAMGEVWYQVNGSSLNALQAGVQRYLDPALWDTAFAPVLFLPAWLVFGAPGLVLAFLCRPREPVRMWL